MNVIKLAKYALSGWLPGGSRRCVMCGHHVWRFMPYMHGTVDTPGLMLALDVVGSNPDQFECPRCGAHDRERHLLMYLERSGLLADIHQKSVLHFAPEKRLARRIAETKPNCYVPCDLYPTAPDVQRVDMLNIPFDDEFFDLVIANHVLEHVSDDLKALAEINRVLKPGGHAILQTPYSAKLHCTWQDAGIDTAAARQQAYGQADHVRLFGNDIFERFTSTGMVSCIRQHSDLLADVDAAALGINPNEPFFLFRRPE